MTANLEERLRRLALHDDHLIESMLAIHLEQPQASGLDPKACALVRLGGLVALCGPCICYQREVQWALAAGATTDEIVGVLTAAAPITGATRVVAAAPELALALGYDLDAAFEAWDEDPG
jgi:4-carboxymuconolactone decarboxylase